MLSPPWRLAIAPPIIVNVRCCVGSLGRGRSFGARGLIALACLTVLVPSTLSRACQHPGNVWSLHGLHECLTRRDETNEAMHIKRQLDKAAARAEMPIRASCYCRQQP